MKIQYLINVFLLMVGCTNTDDVFQQYATVTKPVKLGLGHLSVDSVQWNNVYVSKTRELYFTKMEKSTSAIYRMKYQDGIFHELEKIDFPAEASHSDAYVNPEGNLMLFSSLMQEQENDTVKDWNIWKSVRKNGKWQQPEPFFVQNLEGDQFYPWMAESKNLYFSIKPKGFNNSDLYISEYVNGTYKEPKALPYYINSLKLEGNAFVAPDESYLVFAGFERDQNLGKSDLYISFNQNGRWSLPIWLGADINSEGYDGSPFVTQDEKYLIFTSSRGNSDENIFFNHYIVSFDLNKFLEKENSTPHSGTVPVRFQVGAVTTENVEYGGSISSNNDAIYYTKASSDFRERQITVSKIEDGIFLKPESVVIGGKVYTDASDAQISEDGAYLYFKMKGGVPKDLHRKDGNIWRSKLSNGAWQEAEMLPEEINSTLNEYYPLRTRSGNIYFSREDKDENYDIYVSRWVEGKYQKAEPLPDYINTDLLESDAYVSPDESFMIFVRMYAEGDLGVSDLYISFQENGIWGRPKNMRSLNSEGVDGSPFVTPDGKKLLFTSTRDSDNPENFDGHLDIYAVPFNAEDWR
ncbi:PD40 domain-containing protein [Flagellimonas olearia]|uniref:Uncharacterized protein n=1 Tax=Flagellimonas olearia TaxID=552546 RepID=A0A444VM35_9FLAO|nr:PD40 domain-containing protein [Allomuricauda olearia]RYC51772.1 hypothetical protein DN53_13175 [Allomuricauda olearia]